MMNFKKSKTSKVVSGFVGLATALMMMGPAVASAATVEELTAQINALLAQVQALQSAQSSTTTTTSSGHVFNVDLTVGSKGDDVTALQTFLVSKGFLVMPAGVAMGYFGNLTKAAVAAWQASAGISPAAGYFGPKSRAAVNAMNTTSSSTTTTTTTTTTTPPPVTTTPPTTTTTTTLPVGCTSTTGFSPITGVPCGGTTTTTTSAVNVTLDTSVSTPTLIAGQGVATLAAFKVTNGGSAALKVTMMKFKRTGISADSTLNNVYLYQGSSRLTDSASVATGVVNFTDSAGLFTVPAGASITVLARADIAASTNGQTVGLMLTDVTADAGTVGGLPVSGPELTIAAQPSGIATAGFTGVTPVDNTSLEPQVDFTVWQSSLNIGSRDTLLTAIRFQQIGSAYADDLQNFRLMIDGVAVGTAVEKADANRFVNFSFATPATVKAGTHTVKLVADIVGGSSRTFKFSLRRVVDVELWDSQLGIVVTPTVTGNDGDAVAMTNFPMSAGDITVSSGTITITKATDSPSGNVVKGGSGLTLAKFKVKAMGERLKVENLKVEVTATNEGTTVASQVGSIRNGALFLDGVQIGSTANITTAAAGTQINLGSSMILDTGKEYVLEVRGDAFDGDGTDNLAAGDTWTINLLAGSSNIYKMTSLGYLSNTAVSGNQVTVASGSLTLAKYSAYANQTITLPQTAYKIGEFRLTGGSTEGINLDTINVDLDTSSTTESFLQDVYVVYGSKTSTVKSVGAADLSYSISEVLPVNGAMDIKVYSNLPTTIGSQDTVIVRLTVSGTSQNSGSAVSSATDVVGQTITVGVGSLTTAVDASSPVTSLVVGLSMPKLASFKYNALNDSFSLREIGVTVASANAASAISELVFKDGSTELKRVAMNGTAATATGLSIAVPYNGSKVIDVYGNLGAIGTGFATTSANVAVSLASTKYLNSNGATLWENTVRAGTAQHVFKTKPTITNVALPTTVMSPGSTQTVAKFTITADAGGTLSWRKLILTVATSTPTGSLFVTGYNIYDAANESTVLANTTPTVTTGATVTFISTSDQQVSGSKTYVVKATIGGAPATGASASHYIATGATAISVPDQYAIAAAASPTNTFVWSDESVVGHSATTVDWVGDFLVKNLPTDSQALVK